MTKIETDHVAVNASASTVFEFLSDFNHFEQLLPADKVENWTSDKTSCSFRIKGMADIGMEIKHQQPSTEINIVSKGKVPFDFTLDVFLAPTENADTTEVYMRFAGDINPFMKMMIEKPLRNFFNMLVTKLAEVHSIG